ncbi:MAG: hypothetical protein QM767_22280 [Anaeromyxobacter sp.]
MAQVALRTRPTAIPRRGALCEPERAGASGQRRATSARARSRRLSSLGLDLGALGFAAGAGALQCVEHRAEGELDLSRVHGLGLLAEELALEPLQLVGDQDVELAELVPLVLGRLGAHLQRLRRGGHPRELRPQGFDLGVSRVALDHAPG